MFISLVSLLPLALSVSALAILPAGPVVSLSQGKYLGKSTSNGLTSSWLGIPFASSPRFALPIPIPASSSLVVNDATNYGPNCYQQSSTAGMGGAQGDALGLVANVSSMSFFGVGGSGSAEECLSINVIVPAGQTSTSTPLSVVVWIYGGGFEFGTTSQYEGAPIVARSIATGSPIIYVSMNYRLNGFGFMAGAEIKKAGVGNLGLQDQREALRWVQKNIASFGGNPNAVTLWGESAGAISVALQMVKSGKTNKENLYQAAFMESGAVIPMGQVDSKSAQFYYDFVVAETGCAKSLDTLTCLRSVSFTALAAAIQKTPGILTYVSLNLAYKPRIDGVFFTIAPQLSVAQGDFPSIPFMNGDCEDEGTIFSVSQTNVTTDAQFLAYIKAGYAPSATDAEIAALGVLYPSDPAVGSPYNTSSLYALTPQFKRIASFQGDVVFQAPRRYFFSFALATNKIWSYVYRRNKEGTPLGSYHASDLTTQFYASAFAGSIDYQFIDYLVNFVTTLNPNTVTPSSIFFSATATSTILTSSTQVQSTNPNLIFWPQYSAASPQMLTLLDRPIGGVLGLAITLDTYRIDAINGLIKFALKYGGLN